MFILQWIGTLYLFVFLIVCEDRKQCDTFFPNISQEEKVLNKLIQTFHCS